MLVRPEIGAIIGAVGIWVFFWAVSVPFGTASGAQNILDQASTLGIMAVAVSMLMIGGEFDLSSGANTGAMGILTIFLVKETGELGGAGLPIWLALLISFAVAMGIGWFNGFMVDRTQLPELHRHARHLLRADRSQARVCPSDWSTRSRWVGWTRVRASSSGARSSPVSGNGSPTSSRPATSSTPSSASSGWDS